MKTVKMMHKTQKCGSELGNMSQLGKCLPTMQTALSDSQRCIPRHAGGPGGSFQQEATLAT